MKDPTQYCERRNNLLKAAESIGNWEPSAITGEPRIGKTSFLHYLVHPDGARKQALFREYIGDPAVYLFVLIKPQLFPVRNAQGFWRYLFDRMIEEVRATGIDRESLQAIYHNSLGAGNDDYQIQMSFEQYLKQVGRKVLFLFDSFDILLEDFEDTEMRRVANKLRALRDTLASINYMIVSTDSLSRLFERKGIAYDLSPLPNIIVSAPPLGLLEKEAAYNLLQKPLQQTAGSVPQFSQKDLAFINELAGRHPDFLKISASYLFEAKIHGAVDYRIVRQMITNDDHIQWLMKRLWERIKQDDFSLSEVLLQLAQGQVSPNHLALRELGLRGFVDETVSPPRIFGDLFREFILHAEQPATLSTVSTELAPPHTKLTSLEAKLYNYLAEHAGQICTREQIQQAIWGEKLPLSRDALEQLIRRLRGKIEAGSEKPVLLNIRGQGYLLRQPPTR